MFIFYDVIITWKIVVKSFKSYDIAFCRELSLSLSYASIRIDVVLEGNNNYFIGSTSHLNLKRGNKVMRRVFYATAQFEFAKTAQIHAVRTLYCKKHGYSLAIDTKIS